MSTTSRKTISSISGFFCSLRSLPPAGSTVSPFLFLKNLFLNKKDLRTSIENLYPQHHVYLFNNAKSAITLSLSAITNVSAKNTLALSAYTCPDVATAAIDAGYTLSLFDISSLTLQPEIQSVERTLQDSSVGAILFSNLYGYPDYRPENIPDNIYPVNDACQSALNLTDIKSISTKEISVFSFGRGKAFSAAGGGMLLVPKEDYKNLLFSRLNENIKHNYGSLKEESFFSSACYVLKLFSLWLLEKPLLYWIPFHLPGSGIGETKVKTNNKLLVAGKATTAGIFSCLSIFPNRKAEIHKALNLYSSIIKDLVPEEIIPIRIPLIINPDARKKLKGCDHFVRKHGISFSYPKLISEYPQIKTFIKNTPESGIFDTKGAHTVSRSVITLPLHKYLDSDDVKKILIIIKGK